MVGLGNDSGFDASAVPAAAPVDAEETVLGRVSVLDPGPRDVDPADVAAAGPGVPELLLVSGSP